VSARWPERSRYKIYRMATALVEIRCTSFLIGLCLVILAAVAPCPALSQQTGEGSVQPLPQGRTLGGQGYLWLSQFANPGILGALYQTPTFPYTGIYPLYPGNFVNVIQQEGIEAGPVVLHPHIGVAEMFTDNVLRTSTKRSDFFTTVAPGLQAQLPFGGRHLLVADYRSNLQFFHRTPSNNVQDQTATVAAQLDLASGLKLHLQGEQKFGHDPRGSALDLRTLELNKWSATSFTGRAQYEGGVMGATLNIQSTRWHYLNNNQALLRDRLSNYLGVTLSAKALPNTSLLVDFSVRQEHYDDNKNLDNAIYTISGGAKWDISSTTTGEFLAGYQHLRFTRAVAVQPGPFLSAFGRDQDSSDNFYLMGRLLWMPIADLQITVQPYRTIQQTVVAGTAFFTATGINLSATYPLGTRMELTGNFGYEQDKFSTPAGASAAVPSRSDTLKNAAIGLNYRAVRWLGVGVQYVFEDRSSTARDFTYQANTAMVSVQARF
jgi:hypothetical protein